MKYTVFFDLDDCIIHSSNLIQKAIDENTEFKNNRLIELEQTVSACQKIYSDSKEEIERAFSMGVRPKLGGAIKRGCDDILRSSGDFKNNDEFEFQRKVLESCYSKPLLILERTLKNKQWELEMFFEERDHLLEEDNKKDRTDAIVDYDSIYQKENLIKDVVETVNLMSNDSIYNGVYVLSHHNGGREKIAKERLVNSLFPKVPFMGLRFHSNEYHQNIRRNRSSKALYVMNLFNLDNLNGCILIDDSEANLKEWQKHGGIAILYRPMSRLEYYFNEIEPHNGNYPRIMNLDYNTVEDSISNLNQEKAKILIKDNK